MQFNIWGKVIEMGWAEAADPTSFNLLGIYCLQLYFQCYAGPQERAERVS